MSRRRMHSKVPDTHTLHQSGARAAGPMHARRCERIRAVGGRRCALRRRTPSGFAPISPDVTWHPDPSPEARWHTHGAGSWGSSLAEAQASRRRSRSRSSSVAYGPPTSLQNPQKRTPSPCCLPGSRSGRAAWPAPRGWRHALRGILGPRRGGLVASFSPFRRGNIWPACGPTIRGGTTSDTCCTWSPSPS